MRRRTLLGSAALCAFTLVGCHLILGLTGADERNAGPDAGVASQASPACSAYCRTIGSACAGDERQYQNDAHCLTFCAQLEERGGEPFSCRLSTLEDTQDACSTVGPLGVGPLICEDEPCDLYCDLMSTACPGISLEPGQSGPTGADRDACLDICRDLPVTEPFAVEEGAALLSGSDLNCRIQHINVALLFGAGNRSRLDHCLHAAGQGPGRPCGPDATGVDHAGH